MRPHRLAFCALGPYPGEVEIDFDKLVTDGLFLIWGRTGAGKTFLLDALCFALFGEVPGERPYDTLRSDHAPPDAEPWVELEFARRADAHDTRWRIRRTPRHQRAKKRGAGTAEIAARATLERREGDAWRAVAQKIPEVNAEITQLLGLTASQFQQVVMLPQGRFEKVLRSKSDEREKLLLTLFDTAMFASVSSWLDDEASRRKDAASHLERELGDLRDKAAERWREVLPAGEGDEPLDGSQARSPDSARADSSDGSAGRWDSVENSDALWPADQRQLDDLVGRSQSAAARAAGDAEAADRTHSSAGDGHSEAVQLAGRWDRREHLRQELSRLVNAEADIDAKRETLSRGTAAEVLRQVLDDETDRRFLLNQCAERLSERYAILRGKLAAAPSLPDDLAVPSAQQALVDECAPDERSLPGGRALPSVDDPALQNHLTHTGMQIARHLDKLGKLAESASAASHRESEAAAERDSAAGHLTRQRELDSAAETHDGKRQEAEADLRRARSAGDRICVLRATAGSAQERAEAAVELQALAPELSAAVEISQAARDATRDRRDEELELRRRYLEGIAAVLAGQLVDGSRCPVCGSTEHPIPAEPADNAVSTEQLETAARAVDLAAEAEKLAGEHLREINSRMNELRGRAGDVAAAPDAAAKQAASAAAELEAATELANKESVLREAVEEHQRDAATALQQSGEAATAAALACERADAAESAAEDLRSEIRQAIGEVDVDEAVTDLQAVASCLDELRTSAEEYANARTALGAVTGTLVAQLEQSPFATPDEARFALLAAAERDELRGEVASHDQAMHDTRRDLGADDLLHLPDDRPDADATQEAANAASTAAREARDHHTRMTAASNAIRGWADEHRDMDAGYALALAEAELWTSVADRCGGRMPPRVSLRRWVLSAYLERICERANQRLGDMTGGRYQLSVHRDQERRGAKGGLGLRIRDAYTGAEREVSTLSGGETFQASLALALGVADEVTARSGGTRLDVLFVDEGFGTLDNEALQLAMDVLDRLRESGRAVGLISHVTELRERIQTGIEVRPKDNGSEINVGAFSEV